MSENVITRTFGNNLEYNKWRDINGTEKSN